MDKTINKMIKAHFIGWVSKPNLLSYVGGGLYRWEAGFKTGEPAKLWVYHCLC